MSVYVFDDAAPHTKRVGSIAPTLALRLVSFPFAAASHWVLAVGQHMMASREAAARAYAYQHSQRLGFDLDVVRAEMARSYASRFNTVERNTPRDFSASS